MIFYSSSIIISICVASKPLLIPLIFYSFVTISHQQPVISYYLQSESIKNASSINICNDLVTDLHSCVAHIINRYLDKLTDDSVYLDCCSSWDALDCLCNDFESKCPQQSVNISSILINDYKINLTILNDNYCANYSIASKCEDKQAELIPLWLNLTLLLIGLLVISIISVIIYLKWIKPIS